jgi:hypothetical protein
LTGITIGRLAIGGSRRTLARLALSTTTLATTTLATTALAATALAAARSTMARALAATVITATMSAAAVPAFVPGATALRIGVVTEGRYGEGANRATQQQSDQRSAVGTRCRFMTGRIERLHQVSPGPFRRAGA